jgi:site-specific recombinase XerD
MHPVVRDALTKHPKRVAQGRVGSLVFSRPDGSPMGDVRDGLEGALKRAGVTRRIRFHDLRHTFASHLVMRGVDLRTVAQLLGHRDIKMTMRYAHLAPEHLEAAVNALLSPAERSMEGVLAKSPR